MTHRHLALFLGFVLLALMGAGITVTSPTGYRSVFPSDPIADWPAVTVTDYTVVDFTDDGVPATARAAHVRVFYDSINTGMDIHCRPLGSTEGWTLGTRLWRATSGATTRQYPEFLVALTGGKAECWHSASGVSATTYEARVTGYEL